MRVVENLLDAAFGDTYSFIVSIGARLDSICCLCSDSVMFQALMVHCRPALFRLGVVIFLMFLVQTDLWLIYD